MLPRGVHVKHGAYYLVRNNRWIRLTDRLLEVPAALEAAQASNAADSQEEIAGFARSQLARSRANAKGRGGREHALKVEDIDSMLARCNWRCSVTGTPFSLLRVGKSRPYAPSIDRRDNSIGYTRENCRLVCVAANIAMNTWGEVVLRELMRNSMRMLDSR